MAIIDCKDLTKEFQLGQFASLKDTILGQFRRVAGKGLARRETFKAIDDVSFSVEPGEVLGIIGHNGAGKSTLLKLITKITTPTSGSLTVRGKIAPLIEVGAGFVPNLTGRENVYLNGSILGLSRNAIDRKFDEIVDFSEVERFIDTPVKRYSSGMQVKLAFAVATSVDAEIVIVDEVLAVGDLAFQRKCFDRMEDLIRNENRTVLVVSHNLRQIARMCSRVLMLDGGRIVADGGPQEICALFYEQSNEKIRIQHEKAQSNTQHSSDAFSILQLEVLDKSGNATTKIVSHEPVSVRMKFRINQDLASPEIIVATHTTDFVYLTASSTKLDLNFPPLPSGVHVTQCEFPTLPFKSGAYGLRVVVFDGNGACLFAQDNLLIFEVTNANETQLPPLRLVDIPHKWRCHSE
jgi:ABC-type polysaccharide/polyol phosphate transport system ATPase subunit